MFCFSRVLPLCGVITSLIWRKFTTCLFRLESSLAPSLISQPFSITSAKPSSTSCSLLVCIAVKQTQKIRQVRRTANNSRSSDKGSLRKDDDDGSEDVKNAKGSDAVYTIPRVPWKRKVDPCNFVLDYQNNNFARTWHVFVHFLPSLLD